jgi:trimethylamine--corrinoid protein Co-methyltransferase
VNLPHLLLDDQLFATIKRMVEGVLIDDDHLAVDVINQVGPKGHFLDTDHTFERFREAFLPSELFDRTFRQDWENRGRPDVMDRVRDRIEQILKKHQVQPLSEEQLKQIKEIVEEATATLTTVES